MTREEAIADIRDNIKPVVGGKSLDMAIEALEQEPCEDAISRQAVLDLIEHYNSDGLGSVFYGYEQGVKFADAVNKLPPVTPTEKVGQWEWNQYDSNPKIGNFHCSQCHGIGKSYYDYCPYCKAKMLASPTGAESEG